MPPTIVFFDQLEAIAPIRGADAGSGTADRVVGQLLTELDELQISDRVLVIGATNRPDLIDSSVLRAGRLGLQIEIPLPETPERRAHIALLNQEVGLHFSEADITWLAENTGGYSGADLRALTSVLQIQWLDEPLAAEEDVRKSICAAMMTIKGAM
jgi:transitional endoplasmic reticulum ATPase